MSQLFPLRSSVETGDRDPRLVELEDDRADEVFDCLAAETTRETLAALHDQPRTVSDLADLTDSTVQNAQYHVDKLREAGLVEPVDTWYSERGREMDVYAPADEALVLVAGDDEGRLRGALKRLVGALGLVTGVTYAVTAAAAWLGRPDGGLELRAGGDGGYSARTEPGAEVVTGTAEAAVGLDPVVVAGLACAVGATLALLGVGLWRRL